MTNSTLLTIGVLAASFIATGGAADEPVAKCPACETECPACKADQVTACPRSADADGTLSTLLELRKLFGDPLAGTSLAADECCAEDGFAAALTQVAECAEKPVCTAPTHETTVEVPLSLPAPRPYPSIAAAPYSPPLVAPTPYTPAPHTLAPHTVSYGFVQTVPAIQALRMSARQLEIVASDLEDIGEYDEADGLRQVVTRLRQQARNASPTAHVSSMR